MIKSIGEFEIHSELGRGGMGCVYRAHDPRVGRDVAIKVLSNEGDEDLLARFRSEAGTTAKLNHKNIVTIYAYGEQDGMPYIVMELLEGQDLGKLMKSPQPLPLMEKVRILHQVAEGLSYAHENKIIHRDIKPGNIMLLPDGTVKILDFGIARVTGSNSTRRTQQGYFLGTVAYMAPEQFKLGLDADRLVDIFAYGDVAYQLITGEHPFGLGDPGALMYRITTVEPKPIRDLAPDCPEALSSIIHQLLEKDRDLRCQDLRDVLLDIEPVLMRLRQERAAQILLEAHPLVLQNQVDAALAKVKEALELDPVNREAGQLKRTLQQGLQSEKVRARVTSLCAAAEQKAAERSFAEAISLFETALQLEKSGAIQARLDDIRQAQAKVKLCAQLLAEARAVGRQGDLPAAYQKASEALRTDPQNTEAARIVKGLRDELDRRERRVREAVQLASACAAIREFAEAFAALDKAAGELGESPEIASARARVRELQTEWQRSQRLREFEETLRSARAALKAGSLAQARTGIDLIESRDLDLPNAADCVRDLRRDLAGREEAEVVRAIAEADGLAKTEKFQQALAVLEAARVRYAEHPAVLARIEEVQRLRSAAERKAALAQIAENIVRLRQRGDLEEALEAAKAARNENPDYPLFQEQVGLIENELGERKRRAKVDDTVRRVAPLIKSDPSQAVTLLQAKLAELGPEIELQRLMELARRAAEELRERIARAENLRSVTQAIERSLAAGDLKTGRALVDAAERDFPNEPAIERYRAELARAERARLLETLADSVRQSLLRDDVETAAKHLEACRQQLAGDPEWQSLSLGVKQRRSYLKALETAQQLGNQSKFGDAEGILQEAKANPAADRRADQLLQLISRQRLAAEEEVRERERKERERIAAEARERELKAAAAREQLKREEQERKAAAAREQLQREEQERKAAAAREQLQREEQERKAAAAREQLQREEQERKAAAAREQFQGEERERQELGLRVRREPEGAESAKPQPASEDQQTRVFPVPQPVAASPPRLAPAVEIATAEPAKKTPTIYRRPAIVASAAVFAVLGTSLVWWFSQPPKSKTEPHPAVFQPIPPEPVKADSANVPSGDASKSKPAPLDLGNIGFPVYTMGSPSVPTPKEIVGIPNELLASVKLKWQNPSQKMFSIQTGTGNPKIAVDPRSKGRAVYTEKLVVELPGVPPAIVVVSIRVKGRFE